VNRNLRAFLTANVAAGRPVSPSEALSLDSSLDRLTTQNRALQEQLATDREVMTRALKQQEHDQAVKASLIKEAQRQDRRANLLATALDDVLREFTDAESSIYSWSGKRLRSGFVREQQLDDWHALLPASKTRHKWRTDLISRSQHIREVRKAQANADYAHKRSTHLLGVEEQHAAELRLRAAAEQQLRDVTQERDTLAARVKELTPEHQRLSDRMAQLIGAHGRQTQSIRDARDEFERRWRSTIAEAQRQAARADTAMAYVEAQAVAATTDRAQIADLTRALAETRRRASPTSVSLAEYLLQMGQARRYIADLEKTLQETRQQLAVCRPLGQPGPPVPRHVHSAANQQVSTLPAVDYPTAYGDGVVRVTYVAELLDQLDASGRRRVRWADSDEHTPAYVRTGSLPDHATVTALDGGR